MKKMKKYFALFVALAMVLGTMSLSVFAAKTTASGESGSASITINLPTDNAGTDDEITYHIYKVFDATHNGSSTSTAIAYQIDSVNGALSAAMEAAGFSVDSAGNVSFSGTMDADGNPNASDVALNAIADYAVDEIGSGFTANPSEGTLTISGLEYGYYYITTSTGTAITVDSTNPNATVDDKNTIPGPPQKEIVDGDDFVGSIDEDGAAALAQVGSTVYFQVTIKKVKGAKNYVFHDIMSAGLQYNNDVAVSPTEDLVDNTTTAQGDTVTVTFDNDALAALDDNTDITITYSATVTSAALQTNPANNTATLDYGDGHTTEMDQVEVYNAKFSVVKYDSTDSKSTEDETHTVPVTVGNTTTYYAPLSGAGFVISNGEGYYKIEDNVVSWVSSIDDATEFTSQDDGSLNGDFTGLVDGTYTLIEKTVPAGYNKAADSTFTISASDYEDTNLIQSSNVGNASGQELPSTGGIGTTIFYVLGTILVLAAGVLLVTRRRMRHSEE